MATVTDELVDLHDRIMIKLFSAAKKGLQAGTAENSARRICDDFGVTENLLRRISTHPSNPTGVAVPDSAWTDGLEA